MAAKPPPRTMKLQCVGMRYRVTPTTLRDMAALTPMRVYFKREPQNIHDENAVAVYLNEKPWKNMHVGYISRQTAAEIADRIDSGKIELTGGWLNNVNDMAGTGEMTVEFSRLPSRAKN